METANARGQGPLQSVRCDLCGSSKDRTFLTLPDLLMRTSDHVYRIGRCRVCDLIYLNPRPYEWDIASYYPETYAPFARSSLSSRARSWLHHRSVRDLHRYLGSPNRVLDVGCGTGELLDIIRRAGNANIMGIEPSSQAAGVARRERHLDVRCGTLEQCDFPAESFDTVLLSHVLEHLPSPSRTMQEINRILKPGGTVVIWVPNARSTSAKLLGQYWMGWDVPRHFYVFTPGSLHRLIESVDLTVGEMLHEKHAIEWAWGVRLFAQERLRNKRVDRILSKIHPLLAGLFTPLGMLSAALKQSGRIRLMCHKPIDQIGNRR